MDQTLFHLINEQWTNPALDLFMAAISDVAIWKPALILIVIGLLIFGRFRARACIVCMLVALLLAGQVTDHLKNVIGRERPKQAQRVRMVEMPKAKPDFLKLFHQPTIRYSDASDRKKSGPSFPSGHATNNTVIAVCLTVFNPRRGWLYWIVTLAICYSRIYLGAHWPTDVTATIFLAGGETLLVIALFEFLWKRLAPKWWPGVFSRHRSLVYHSAK